MNRLIVESSTTQASIALFADSELLVEEIFPSGRGPVSQFFSILKRTLKRGETIDELVVGVGPGSYSGIRIGISAVIGLQLARQIPAAGVISTLGFADDNYHVLLDARGSWIYSKVLDGKLAIEPVNCTRDEVLEKLDSSLIVLSPDAISEFKTERAFPLASMLGKRSWSPQPLQPLYLKNPHVTVAKTAPLF